MPAAPHRNYRPTALRRVRSTARFRTDNAAVDDVLAAYERIRTDGDYLRAWDGGHIPRGGW